MLKNKYIDWVLSIEDDPNKKEEYKKYYESVNSEEDKISALPCEKVLLNGKEIPMLDFAKFIYEKNGIIPLNIYECSDDDPSKDRFFKIDCWSEIREECLNEVEDASGGIYDQLYRKMDDLNEYLEF